VYIGGLNSKQGAESHDNIVPPLARSLKRAIQYCVDWNSIPFRLVKTDGDAANKEIVNKAINYLIEVCGPTITNKPSGEAVNLEDLRKRILVYTYIYVLL